MLSRPWGGVKTYGFCHYLQLCRSLEIADHKSDWNKTREQFERRNPYAVLLKDIEERLRGEPAMPRKTAKCKQA